MTLSHTSPLDSALRQIVEVTASFRQNLETHRHFSAAMTAWRQASIRQTAAAIARRTISDPSPPSINSNPRSIHHDPPITPTTPPNPCSPVRSKAPVPPPRPATPRAPARKRCQIRRTAAGPQPRTAPTGGEHGEDPQFDPAEHGAKLQPAGAKNNPKPPPPPATPQPHPPTDPATPPKPPHYAPPASARPEP